MRAQLPRKLWVPVFAFTITLPFFVNILGPSGVELGKIRSTYENPGITLPLSVFILAIFLAGWSLKSIFTGKIALVRSGYIRTVTGLALLFIYFNIISALIGQFIAFEYASGIFLLQSIIPIFSMFVIIYLVGNRIDRLLAALRAASLGVLLGVAAAVSINAMRFGSGMITRKWIDNYRGVGIYQLHDYVPNIMATFVPILLGMALLSRHRFRRGIYIAGVALSLFAIAHLPSISAIIIAGLGIALFAIGIIPRLPLRRTGALVLVLVVLMIVSTLSLKMSGIQQELAKILESPSSLYQFGSVRNRLDKWARSIVILFRSPLWGKGYVVFRPLSLRPGGLVVERRIAKPHNQYLEVALKAGFPALLVFLMLVFIPVVALAKGIRNSGSDIGNILGWSLLSAILPSLLVHALFLVPFTQTYSGIILYMLSGLALCYYASVKSTKIKKVR